MRSFFCFCINKETRVGIFKLGFMTVYSSGKFQDHPLKTVGGVVFTRIGYIFA